MLFLYTQNFIKIIYLFPNIKDVSDLNTYCNVRCSALLMRGENIIFYVLRGQVSEVSKSPRF